MKVEPFFMPIFLGYRNSVAHLTANSYFDVIDYYFGCPVRDAIFLEKYHKIQKVPSGTIFAYPPSAGKPARYVKVFVI